MKELEIKTTQSKTWAYLVKFINTFGRDKDRIESGYYSREATTDLCSFVWAFIFACFGFVLFSILFGIGLIGLAVPFVNTFTWFTEGYFFFSMAEEAPWYGVFCVAALIVYLLIGFGLVAALASLYSEKTYEWRMERKRAKANKPPNFFVLWYHSFKEKTCIKIKLNFNEESEAS